MGNNSSTTSSLAASYMILAEAKALLGEAGAELEEHFQVRLRKKIDLFFLAKLIQNRFNFCFNFFYNLSYS